VGAESDLTEPAVGTVAGEGTGPVLETLQGSRLTLSRGLKSGDGPARASPNSGGAVAFSTSNPWSRHDGPPLAVQLR
jgi:hypothetical protein